MRALVITSQPVAASETFIGAHVEALSYRKTYLIGFRGFYRLPNEPVGHNPLWKQIAKRLPVINKRFKAYGYLRHYLKTNKIEAVLAEYGPVGVDVMGVCKELNIPLIVHFHGYDAAQTDLLKQYATPYKKLFQQAFKVIAVSQEMMRDLQALGCPAEKICYNPCAPASEFFEVKPNSSSLQFISVGRFVDKKAPYLTLMAFAQVQKQFPEATLLMVGDGILLATCKQLVKSLQLNHVRFTGVLTPEIIREQVAASFCLVQHSVQAANGDKEGTPVAVLEAGAAGLPVVATRHAGIPDVVINGETGLLVDEGDVVAMAAAMIQLYANRALAAKMGAQARSRIQQHFTMEKHISIITALIQSAVRLH